MKTTKKLLSLALAAAMLLSLGCAAFAAADDWADYQQYVISYAVAGAPTEEDAADMSALILACDDMDALLAVEDLGVFFAVLGCMEYEDWVAAGSPAEGTLGASGEASDDASGEPSGEASDDASGEPSGEVDEAAYKAYLKEFVASVGANAGVEEEFYAVIDAGNYYDFPMVIGFEGMWGEIPMTLEEFIAAGGQYVIPDLSGVAAD